MPDEKKIETALDKFYYRYDKFNSNVLKKLGNIVKQFDGLNYEEAHALAQELKIGYDLYEMELELSKISGKSVRDVDILLEKIARENVEFSEAYYKAKHMDYIQYDNNMRIQYYVESVKKQTNDLFRNLANSQNIGFTIKDNKNNIIYKPLKNVYNDLVDEAVFNVSLGVEDYQSAMENTLRNLADSGIKIHEEKLGYKSGYNRRLDSAIKQNILTGMRQINIGIQEQIGEELGADGVEISAHYPCANDHLDIQGKQFSKEKFEKLNGSLTRPIGELNCRHFVFSIIMGVQEPSHTDAMLEQFKQESLAKVEYEGKTYTKYEATQVQRKLETAIRRQKDRNIIAKSSGNEKEKAKSQEKIRQLTAKYNNFSKSTGLRTYKNRLRVVGYDDKK